MTEHKPDKLTLAISALAKLPQFHIFLEHVYLRTGAHQSSRHMDEINRYDPLATSYNLGMSEAWLVIAEKLPTEVLLEVMKGVRQK